MVSSQAKGGNTRSDTIIIYRLLRTPNQVWMLSPNFPMSLKASDVLRYSSEERPKRNRHDRNIAAASARYSKIQRVNMAPTGKQFVPQPRASRIEGRPEHSARWGMVMKGCRQGTSHVKLLEIVRSFRCQVPEHHLLPHGLHPPLLPQPPP